MPPVHPPEASTESRKTECEIGARTLPQRYFVSRDIFAREQESIFNRHWLLVGHRSQLARAGDYLVADVAGESVLVVQEQAGTLRAFYNVCRHRGTRLCENNAGHLRAIQCPYHAWTYALDGRLLGAPHMEEVFGFSKADYSLTTLPLALWEGFVFVNLSPVAASLDEEFAPLKDKFLRWNLPELMSARQIRYEVRANWKLIFENYSECYHCPGVHPLLAKVSPYDSAENDLSEGPFLGGFMSIAQGASLTLSGNVCALPVGEMGASDHARVFYYSIFPNMLLSLHPDYVMVHQLWPESPNQTLILCDWFFHPHAAREPNYNPADAIDFWHLTNQQDWHVCELSQQGIESRAYSPGPYSSRESIPAAWDREYLRQMGVD